MKRFIPILIFFFMTNSTRALEVALIGGGGVPAGPSTMFDLSLRALSNTAQRIPMNISGSFNGGHENTESILKNGLHAETSKITNANIRIYLDNLREKILKGIPDKKLLIILNSHGFDEKDPTKTHRISTDNDKPITSLDELEHQESGIYVDELKDILNLAKDKGVKVGLLDFTCHSGHSIKLADENTCVITASGPNHYGFIGTASNFFNQMYRGKNLEELFLENLERNSMPSFPMISTEAGKLANQSLYTLFAPYLNYALYPSLTSDNKEDKLIPYLAAISDSPQCLKDRENKFNELTTLIENISKTTGHLLSFSDKSNLIERLRSYKAIQDEMLFHLKMLNAHLLVRPINLEYDEVSESTGKIKPAKIKMAVADLFSNKSQINAQINKIKKSLSVATMPMMKALLTSDLNKLSAIKRQQDRLLKEDPMIEDKINGLEEFKRKIVRSGEKLKDAASYVGELSSKIYIEQYRAQKETHEGPNPCAAFTL